MFFCKRYYFQDSSLAVCWGPLLGSFLILTSGQGEKAGEPYPEAGCVCGRSCLGVISKADATVPLLILTMLPGTFCHVGSLETILASSKQELAAAMLFFLSV